MNAPNSTIFDMANQQRVEIKDGKGRYGRIDFMLVFSKTEHSKIISWYQKHPDDKPEWLDLLDHLAVHPDTGDIGWWKPGRFQIKPCVETIPAKQKLDPGSLGWEAVAALRPYQKVMNEWIDTALIETKLGDLRKGYQEFLIGERAPQILEGSSMVGKIEKEGIQLIPESFEDILQTDCFVVYSAKSDSYLTNQYIWKGLNRAALFTSYEAAEKIIESRFKNDRDIQIAKATLRIDTFPKPEILGSGAKKSLSFRDAALLNEATESIDPPSSANPRRMRL